MFKKENCMHGSAQTHKYTRGGGGREGGGGEWEGRRGRGKDTVEVIRKNVTKINNWQQ
jgi:hypothetical protein